MTKFQHGFIAQAAAPASPETGDIWVDMTGKQIKQWSGTAWNIYTPKPLAVAELAADFSTASSSYVDFFTTTFTPSGTSLAVRVEGFGSASAAATLTFFRLAVDAATKTIGCVNEHAMSAQFSFGRTVKFTGLTPGVAVTVKAQVKTAAGTFSCRAVAFPEHEGASLVIHDTP